MSTDKNISTKEFDSASDYKNLGVEVTRKRYLNTTLIPVVIGAPWMIKHKTDTDFNKILRNQP